MSWSTPHAKCLRLELSLSYERDSEHNAEDSADNKATEQARNKADEDQLEA